MCNNIIMYTHSNCTHHPTGFDSSRLRTVPTNALRLVLLRTSRLGYYFAPKIGAYISDTMLAIFNCAISWNGKIASQVMFILFINNYWMRFL